MIEKLPGDSVSYEPCMPEVDVQADVEKIFDEARIAAAKESASDGRSRQVVVITPGRMLMMQPCPPPGSMPKTVVGQIERLLPPKVKRRIAVIGYTELRAVTGDLAKAIPFFGLLTGIAYIGHLVWVFEGHSSALAAGCKNADLLIVDGSMVPHLAANWQSVASGSTPKPEIYVHDRATHSLRKIK